MSAFSAKVADTESGLFVTLGTYSAQAQNSARSQPRIRLIGGPELVSMILEHYEELLPKYKTLIPLRRLYVRADSYEGD